jgi:pheromone shutdown protein TraB
MGIHSLNSLKNINDTIFFLGTMHLGENSAILVEKQISEGEFDYILVELDEMRYQSMFVVKNTVTPQEFQESQNEESVPENLNQTDSNSFVDILKNLQKEMGDLVGLMPGIEIKTALQMANKYQIPFKLIDQPINITIQHLQELPDNGLKEKQDLIESIRDDPIGSDDMTEIMEEFQKPGFIREALREFKKSFPEIYKVLITERNDYMANQIITIHRKYPQKKLFIVIGAGHIMELIDLVENQLK